MMAGRSTDDGRAGPWDVLFRLGAVGDLPDARLLGLFLEGGDGSSGAAFEALVARHGRMVDGTCRQVLGNPDDAQDAFQATFLILARRAGSIRRPEALAGWLHEIAVRVATRARSAAARRRALERRGAAGRCRPDRAATDRPETWPELHEEIARLPPHYREPVVLCYLEGLSVEAAASRLGRPRGTVLSRLARARGRLKLRLARRGLGPADLALLPPRLIPTVGFRAAAGLTTPSPVAGRLMKGVLMKMALERLGRAGMLLLACGSTAGGLVAVAGRTAAQDHPPGPPIRVEAKRDAAPGRQARALAYAPDGGGIAAQTDDGGVMILDPRSGDHRVILQGRAGPVHAIAYAPDGTTLAGAGVGNSIRFWDPATGALRRTISVFGGVALRATALAFTPDGASLAIAGRAEPDPADPRGAAVRFGIALVDVAGGQVVWSHSGRGSIATAVAVAPDGRTLASSAGMTSVRLWDARTGEPGLLLETEGASPLRLAFAPDGKRLAAAGFRTNPGGGPMIGQVNLWDPATGARLRTLDAPNRAVALAFAPDGRTIAAGGSGPVRRDTTANGAEAALLVSETRAWDVATGDRLWSSWGDLGGVTALAFAPDGGSLVRSDDETVAAIDPRTGGILRVLRTIPGRF